MQSSQHLQVLSTRPKSKENKLSPARFLADSKTTIFKNGIPFNQRPVEMHQNMRNQNNKQVQLTQINSNSSQKNKKRAVDSDDEDDLKMVMGTNMYKVEEVKIFNKTHQLTKQTKKAQSANNRARHTRQNQRSAQVAYTRPSPTPPEGTQMVEGRFLSGITEESESKRLNLDELRTERKYNPSTVPSCDLRTPEQIRNSVTAANCQTSEFGPEQSSRADLQPIVSVNQAQFVRDLRNPLTDYKIQALNAVRKENQSPKDQNKSEKQSSFAVKMFNYSHSQQSSSKTASRTVDASSQ